MKIVPIAAVLATALTAIAGSPPARATDIDVYRTDHDGANCRVVVTTTTNRWGDEVTVRHRVCG